VIPVPMLVDPKDRGSNRNGPGVHRRLGARGDSVTPHEPSGNDPRGVLQWDRTRFTERSETDRRHVDSQEGGYGARDVVPLRR
jgi:hypothetical protein